MINHKEQAQLVEFEIVRGSEETMPGPERIVQSVSPWQVVRFILMGLAGLALFFVVLGLGAMFLIPVLIFIVISRIIGSLLSANPPRR